MKLTEGHYLNLNGHFALVFHKDYDVQCGVKGVREIL